MSVVSETPPPVTEKPVRRIFKPDWGLIRELVKRVSVHCSDIAAELGIRRETLARHCQKTFGKPFRLWAKDVRRLDGIVNQFSPIEYKALIRAYHSGALAFKDRNDVMLNKPKSPKPPQPFGPTTAPPLTERLTYHQVGAALHALGAKTVWIGDSQVSAGYPIAVWLDARMQAPDSPALVRYNERPEKLCWELTPLGIQLVSESLVLFHKELDRRYFNPGKSE